MDEGAAMLAELALMKLLSINPQPLQTRRFLGRARKLSSTDFRTFEQIPGVPQRGIKNKVRSFAA
jgi:hypothetical protein